MLLAGDIGGTKTLLGLFDESPSRPTRVEVKSFATLSFDSLPDMIGRFLESAKPGRVAAAACGVAGPVIDEAATLTNVPWRVDARRVAERFGFPRVSLLNDLEATAYSVPVLRDDELLVLQRGEPDPEGNLAVIAAGT